MILEDLVKRVGEHEGAFVDALVDADLRAPLAAVHDVLENFVNDEVVLGVREERLVVLVPEVPAHAID